jgi:tryptophan synthase alpha chain
MSNRIDQLFAGKKTGNLNIYCTAGFPQLDDTLPVMTALQKYGADMIELGMPFSDPLADGPVIQESSTRAIANGMGLKVLFEQLKGFRDSIHVPVLLMGYLNPVLLYGIEAFCEKCAEVGVDGLILPDLPMDEYVNEYRPVFEKYGLHLVFLVTPETSEARIRKIDEVSRGFIYAVSSSSTTGTDKDMGHQQAYFERLEKLQLKNPIMIGFGVKDKATFAAACAHSNGAIIGTAFIRALEHATNIDTAIKDFISSVK